MSWVIDSTGDATCIKDYESMHAPVVELLTVKDLGLAVNYLNPALDDTNIKDLYEQGVEQYSHTFQWIAASHRSIKHHFSGYTRVHMDSLRLHSNACAFMSVIT